MLSYIDKDQFTITMLSRQLAIYMSLRYKLFN
jgi:hypothetical protein